jgi:hypothetical protein
LDVFGDTPTRNQHGLPLPNFLREGSSVAPFGFGCARLATLAFAPPHPKGVTLEGRRRIYRNRFTPTLEVSLDKEEMFSGLLLVQV